MWVHGYIACLNMGEEHVSQSLVLLLIINFNWFLCVHTIISGGLNVDEEHAEQTLVKLLSM